MTSTTTTSPFALVPSLETAWQDVDSSFAERSGRLGNSMMPTKLSGCCAISPAGSTARRPVSPPASLKGSMRC